MLCQQFFSFEKHFLFSKIAKKTSKLNKHTFNFYWNFNFLFKFISPNIKVLPKLHPIVCFLVNFAPIAKKFSPSFYNIGAKILY